jgi:hypothetical protein
MGRQRLPEITEHQKDTQKVNVWHDTMKEHIIGHLLFKEATVTSHSYLDMSGHYTVLSSLVTHGTCHNSYQLSNKTFLNK